MADEHAPSHKQTVSGFYSSVDQYRLVFSDYGQCSLSVCAAVPYSFPSVNTQLLLTLEFDAIFMQNTVLYYKNSHTYST